MSEVGLSVGGRCHFLPQDDPQSCRFDDKDLIAQAKEEGFNYIPDRETFDDLTPDSKISLPLLGLFSSAVLPLSVPR
jgi:alkaline phosphatase